MQSEEMQSFELPPETSASTVAITSEADKARVALQQDAERRVSLIKSAIEKILQVQRGYLVVTESSEMVAGVAGQKQTVVSINVRVEQ